MQCSAVQTAGHCGLQACCWWDQAWPDVCGLVSLCGVTRASRTLPAARRRAQRLQALPGSAHAVTAVRRAAACMTLCGAHAEHDVAERVEVAPLAVRPCEGGIPRIQGALERVVRQVWQRVGGSCARRVWAEPTSSAAPACASCVALLARTGTWRQGPRERSRLGTLHGGLHRPPGSAWAHSGRHSAPRRGSQTGHACAPMFDAGSPMRRSRSSGRAILQG